MLGKFSHAPFLPSEFTVIRTSAMGTQSFRLIPLVQLYPKNKHAKNPVILSGRLFGLREGADFWGEQMSCVILMGLGFAEAL